MSLFKDKKKQEIVNRINQLTPNSQALWGKMNVNQMFCHTADQFRIAFGEKKPEKPAKLIDKTIAKWLVLYLIDIPKGVAASAKVDPFEEGTKPIDFETDKKTLLGYIEKFCSMPTDYQWSEDFKFGKVNGKEWSILTYKHLHHHLKQFGV